MQFLNPKATRRLYDADLARLMSIAKGRESRTWLSTWSCLAPTPTPTWSLPKLAAVFEVGSVHVKDESKRSELGSFKALGAPIALLRLVLRRWPDQHWRAVDLFAGVHAKHLHDLVVISATDGNHGRALAAAAQSIGCRGVIVLHANVSMEREKAIAAFGAEIVRVAGNYDDSVAEAADLAAKNHWEVVSDTSCYGYEEIPRDVMQGYGIMVDELLEDSPQGALCPFTHVIVQGGVGGLAAGVVSHFWERYGAQRPSFIIVEPEQADCLFQSALLGRAARATGSVDSVMAGLACGETSPLAWQFLQPAVDMFMTVTDTQAETAMRALADGVAGDMPIVSGESGAAGFAALQALVSNDEWRQKAGLDTNSRIVLFNTEGATAPAVYKEIIGRDAKHVLIEQETWLIQRGNVEE